MSPRAKTVALERAYQERDRFRLLEIAWVRAGSWELDAIALALESLAKQAWGAEWELALADMGFRTTADLRSWINRYLREYA